MQLQGQFAELESLNSIADNDFDSAGVLAGVDYRLTEKAIIGLGIAYNRTEVDYANGGRADGEVGRFTGFGTYALPYGLHLEGTVGMAVSSYDVKRPIQFSSIDRTARNDVDGTQFFTSVGLGRDFRSGNLRVTPSVNFQYTYADLEGGLERGADALNLNIHDISTESYRLNAGVEVAYDAPLMGSPRTPRPTLTRCGRMTSAMPGGQHLVGLALRWWSLQLRRRWHGARPG